MKISFLQEPELRFGTGEHVDVRFGIMNHGPLDYAAPHVGRQVHVGLVGTTETTEGVAEWLEKCRLGIPAKESRQPNLFPRFPGCSPDAGLRTTLVTTPQSTSVIPKIEIDKLVRTSTLDLIPKAVDLFLSEIRHLAENVPTVQTIVCALPMDLLEAMDQRPDSDRPQDEETDDSLDMRLDFHHLLKARAMDFRKPIQLVLPMTYDETKRRMQKKRPGVVRRLQDEATRAWNFHTALYYKAGGVPWRIVRDSTQLTVCYIGISFYKTLDGSSLMTSIAQVFNERGEGVIVRGGTAQVSKEDLQPHLSAEDADELLRGALARYREVHRTLPARVVLHKSSTFSAQEIEGFQSALAAERVTDHDFISIGPSDTRLFRGGAYPPLRGTLLSLTDTEQVLYTRGSVHFFETYPGMYIPVPKLLRFAATEQTPKFLANEILSLTKMNWNNTQFDGALPITLRAARRVSEILKYCEEGTNVEPRYSFYM